MLHLFRKLKINIKRRGILKNILSAIWIGIFIYILNKLRSFYVIQEDVPHLKSIDSYFPNSNARPITSKVYWVDKIPYEVQMKQRGIGEGGGKAVLRGVDVRKKKDIWDMAGFDGLLSDHIALNRSLKDIRHQKCKELKYNRVLPSVSVVIPFFEEHLSVLLRTIVSVMNRSPAGVVKEIILVDDGSSMIESTKEPLDNWLRKYCPIGRVIRRPSRGGLIQSRQDGAKAATGDVLVVLDSHCEVMTGWLPPLLEPIVNNPHTAVCPLIDIINADSFSYYPQDDGGRGGFDWRFYYKRLPLRDVDQETYPDPFPNPVMNGGLFAINLNFFWDIGGYDTGIRIWGGEQYELSFKIWMCGGQILDAPCSRVGHIFRQGGSKRPPAMNAGDYINNNYKRVAAVWMDEYAEAIYLRRPELRNFPPGDISRQLEFRKKCKPFKWFMEEVANDLPKSYPPWEPPDFANGFVKSYKFQNYCIDRGGRSNGPLELYGSCHGQNNQYFHFSWEKTIEIEDEQFCWHAGQSNHGPEIVHCQLQPPDQFIFRYDPDTHQITSKLNRMCLDIDVNQMVLKFANCDGNSDTQKWIVQNVNKKAISERYPYL